MSLLLTAGLRIYIRVLHKPCFASRAKFAAGKSKVTLNCDLSGNWYTPNQIIFRFCVIASAITKQRIAIKCFSFYACRIDWFMTNPKERNGRNEKERIFGRSGNAVLNKVKYLIFRASGNRSISSDAVTGVTMPVDLFNSMIRWCRVFRMLAQPSICSRAKQRPDYWDWDRSCIERFIVWPTIVHIRAINIY